MADHPVFDVDGGLSDQRMDDVPMPHTINEVVESEAHDCAVQVHQPPPGPEIEARDRQEQVPDTHQNPPLDLEVFFALYQVAEFIRYSCYGNLWLEIDPEDCMHLEEDEMPKDFPKIEEPHTTELIQHVNPSPSGISALRTLSASPPPSSSPPGASETLPRICESSLEPINTSATASTGNKLAEGESAQKPAAAAADIGSSSTHEAELKFPAV